MIYKAPKPEWTESGRSVVLISNTGLEILVMFMSLVCVYVLVRVSGEREVRYSSP